MIPVSKVLKCRYAVRRRQVPLVPVPNSSAEGHTSNTLDGEPAAKIMTPGDDDATHDVPVGSVTTVCSACTGKYGTEVPVCSAMTAGTTGTGYDGTNAVPCSAINTPCLSRIQAGSLKRSTHQDTDRSGGMAHIFFMNVWQYNHYVRTRVFLKTHLLVAERRRTQRTLMIMTYASAISLKIWSQWHCFYVLYILTITSLF